MEGKGKQYVCPKCEYRFAQKRYLINHIQSVHSQIRFSCNECEFVSKSKLSLYSHVRSQHKGKSNKCTKCEYFSSNLKQFKLHNQIYHDGFIHKCKYCIERFQTKREKVKHKKIFHKHKFETGEIVEEGEIVEGDVKIPSIFVNNIEELDKTIISMMKKNQGEKWTCLCGKYGRDKGLISRHVEANHIKGLSHKCAICHDNFNTRMSLNGHQRKSCGSSPKKIKEIKSSTGSMQNTMIDDNKTADQEPKSDRTIDEKLNEQTITNYDPDLPPIYIEIIPLLPKGEIDNEKIINEEVSKFMIRVTGGWQCIKCKKTHSQKNRIEVHIENKHFDGGRYQCQKCYLFVKARYTLKLHQREGSCAEDEKLNLMKLKTHAMEELGSDTTKEVHCTPQKNTSETMDNEIVGELTVDRNHKRKENQEMPQCEMSNDKTLDEEIMLMKRKFNGVWQCIKCSKLAVSKESLELHIESKHINSGGHKCYLCDKILKTRHSLKIHIKNIHHQVEETTSRASLKEISAEQHKLNEDILQMVIKVSDGWQCIECKKTARLKDYIKHHVESNHTEGHLCKECNRNYKTRKSLKDHRKLNHFCY